MLGRGIVNETNTIFWNVIWYCCALSNVATLFYLHLLFILVFSWIFIALSFIQHINTLHRVRFAWNCLLQFCKCAWQLNCCFFSSVCLPEWARTEQVMSRWYVKACIDCWIKIVFILSMAAIASQNHLQAISACALEQLYTWIKPVIFVGSYNVNSILSWNQVCCVSSHCIELLQLGLKFYGGQASFICLCVTLQEITNSELHNCCLRCTYSCSVFLWLTV